MRVAVERDRYQAGALLAVLIATTLASPARAIHRGYDAPLGSYRFMVSLRLAETPDSHRCGGTLIKPDIVLTAAHCVALVPAGGLVAVVGHDVPDWPKAPRISTLGHRVPETFDFRIDNRDDIAVVRLAAPQSTPGIRLAGDEPRVGVRVVTAGWGCTNAPPVCRVQAANLKASGQTVLRDVSCGRDVFWTRPTYNARTNICTKGIRLRSTINRGDSGGPLLIRDRRGAFRQVGVTALGSDSTTKLYAGFTSVPVERKWIDAAIRSFGAARGSGVDSAEGVRPHDPAGRAQRAAPHRAGVADGQGGGRGDGRAREDRRLEPGDAEPPPRRRAGPGSRHNQRRPLDLARQRGRAHLRPLPHRGGDPLRRPAGLDGLA